MGKQTAQGTRWESRIRDNVRAIGRAAMRLPKTGKKNEPDLVIYPDDDLDAYRLAVAWERWRGKKREGRRSATRMFIVDEETFYEMLDFYPYGWYVQCKSTQAGSVSTWLEGLRERINEDE